MNSSLSVVAIARDTTGRLSGILELVRPYATEIVVALDDSTLDEAAAALGDVADVVFAIPFRMPVERSLPWLHQRCSGNWIFRLDDDEVPSAALLGALDELTANRSLSHCFIPRRWLWQSPDTYLDAPPWAPDYQLRLVRNEPSLVWFPGVTHWPVQAQGAHRYLDAPIYHFDLLSNPLERRRAKADAYEAKEPGRRIAGLAFNTAYYLPELQPGARLGRVEEADERAIAAVLDARPAGTTTRVPQRVSDDEIEAEYQGRPFQEQDYLVELAPVGELPTLRAGDVVQLDVRVANRGARTLPPGGLGLFAVMVSYRWSPGGDGLRTPLPEALAPGAATRVPVAIAVPAEPGSYRLTLDLVHDHVRWFGRGVELDVGVVAQPRIAIFGEDEDLQRAAAAAVTTLRPEVAPVVLARDPPGSRARLGYESAPSGHDEILRPGTAASLSRAARYALRGRPERASALFVVGKPASRRERLVEAAMVRAARRIGLPVLTARTASDIEAAVRSLPG